VARATALNVDIAEAADVAVLGVSSPDLGEEVRAVVRPLDMAEAAPNWSVT
jgi:hypothetical protein